MGEEDLDIDFKWTFLEETNQPVSKNVKCLSLENAGGGDFVELFINAGSAIIISSTKIFIF